MTHLLFEKALARERAAAPFSDPSLASANAPGDG
jgi:hypothetical protein